jgi:hypothetical protein
MAERAATHRPRNPTGAGLALMVLAVASSGLCAWFILQYHRIPGGAFALVAVMAEVAGRDLGGTRGLRGRFVQRLLDRLFEAAVLTPLAWDFRATAPRVSVLALVALGASYVASYELAKGTALGYLGHETVGYRTLRAAILAAGLLSGWIEASLWVFTALTVAAAAVRWTNVTQQDRRARRQHAVGGS